jgi:hypothetical protein
MQAMPARGGLTRQLALFAPPVESPRDVDFHALSRPARAYTGDFHDDHRPDPRLRLARAEQRRSLSATDRTQRRPARDDRLDRPGDTLLVTR